jgi:predicted secreted protein
MQLDPIITRVDEEFSVSLHSTPSTGYVWVLQSLPKSIELLGSSYINTPGEKRPGDPLTQVFRFQGGQSGESMIVFALKRQWEDLAIDTRSLSVTVLP